MSQFPKRCSCGRSHGEAAWRSLHYVGVFDSGEEILELRNCSCGSTISVLAGPLNLASAGATRAVRAARGR